MDVSEAVRELVDRRELEELVHAYCDRFDRNDPEGVAALFAPEATVDYGPEFPTIAGAGEIAAAIAGGLERTFAATSHHVSNVSLTFEGPDRARGLVYLYAWHRYRDGSPDGELWGRYELAFERTAGGWRIAALVLRAAGTRSFHRSAMHPIGRR